MYQVVKPLLTSFWAWLANSAKYWTTMESIAETCLRLGISITYVVWNTTEAGPPALKSLWDLIPRSIRGTPDGARILKRVWDRAVAWDQLQRRALFPASDVFLLDEPWFGGHHSEPGNFYFTNPDVVRASAPAFDDFVDLYLAELGERLSRPGSVGRRVLASYDLFNESDDLFGRAAVPIPRVLDFIYRTYKILWEQHNQNNAPEPPCTVGWAGPTGRLFGLSLSDLVVSSGTPLAYFSTHSYDPNVSSFRANLAIAVRDAQLAGKPYVCSEVWNSNILNIDGHLQALLGLGAGGQMWGYLESNVFFSRVTFAHNIPDGIVVPTLQYPHRWKIAWPTGQELSFPISNRTGVDRTADQVAIRRWSGTLSIPPVRT